METTRQSTGKQNTMPESRPLATVLEVANRLSISRATTYALMEQGALPYVKIGKCRRVRWEDVESLIERNRVGALLSSANNMTRS